MFDLSYFDGLSMKAAIDYELMDRHREMRTVKVLERNPGFNGLPMLMMMGEMAELVGRRDNYTEGRVIYDLVMATCRRHRKSKDPEMRATVQSLLMMLDHVTLMPSWLEAGKGTAE